MHWISGADDSDRGEIGLHEWAVIGRDLGDRDWAAIDPMRIRTSKGVRHRSTPAMYVWQPTRSHVWCESQQERWEVLWLEFSGQVERLWAQPMAITFGHGSRPSGYSHTPDLLALFTDGSYGLFDVRPAELVDDHARVQFGETVAICDVLGWRYRVLTGTTHARRAISTVCRRRATTVVGRGTRWRQDDWLVISMPELFSYAGTARRDSTTLSRRFHGSDRDWAARDVRPHPDDAGAADCGEGRRVGWHLVITHAKGAVQTTGKVYKSEGVAGVDARLHPKGKKRLVISKADPRLIAVIDRELDSPVNMSTSSRRHCALLVRRTLETMYPGDPIFGVKDTTLQGYINERDAGRYTLGKATTRRNTSNSPDREFFSGNAHGPGAVCEIDSTPLDVQVWDDRGNTFRPTATALFCVASRVPLAWAIHADRPNGFDHALLLARAIVGRRAVPGSEAATLSGSATLPADLMKKISPYLDDEVQWGRIRAPPCLSTTGRLTPRVAMHARTGR